MVQMRLAQTLADAFMECWKVKYIYQTKRPDMTDKTIQEVLAMPNPPFPSYVSGHSTISFAGAEILAHFFPNKREIFIKHATQAKNSRLWAGIHFPHDNDEGQKLGEEVAKNIINNL
jgi:membrane-associated phospholipid phosphatase